MQEDGDAVELFLSSLKEVPSWGVSPAVQGGWQCHCGCLQQSGVPALSNPTEQGAEQEQLPEAKICSPTRVRKIQLHLR